MSLLRAEIVHVAFTGGDGAHAGGSRSRSRFLAVFGMNLKLNNVPRCSWQSEGCCDCSTYHFPFGARRWSRNKDAGLHHMSSGSM